MEVIDQRKQFLKFMQKFSRANELKHNFFDTEFSSVPNFIDFCFPDSKEGIEFHLRASSLDSKQEQCDDIRKQEMSKTSYLVAN